MHLDLHVHLRGTIGPCLAQRLARQNQHAFGATLSEAQQYTWSDFSDFLAVYDAVAAVVRSARDLEEVAFSYLAASAVAGTGYVEFMLSPPDLLRNGISYPDQLAALSAAWERARTQYGIESRLIVTCVRHLGPDAAVQAALQASSISHPYVVGFGMTGDERQFEVSDFIPAFEIARGAGLRLTAHAGEHRDAPSIREAVDRLGLDRVAHGVRAPEDATVMAYLAERRIGLEICISSNLALGLYRSLADHPLPKIVAAGIPVSLGTDDPGFFCTSPSQEYDLAAKICRLDRSGQERISRDAIDLSFCDETTKGHLRNSLDKGIASPPYP
jgi:adenosine deaminase